MPGLFDFGDDRESQQNLGLLGLMTGLGMMQANQPGASFGQAVGAGGMQGLQGLMQMRQMAQRDRQNKALLAQGQQRMTPNSVREYEYAKQNGFAGTFEDYRKVGAAASQPAAPIQNFTHRQDLVKQYGETSPEVRTFDNYVRAMPYLNTGPAFVQPGIAGTPNIGNVIPTGLKPGEEPAVRGQQAQAAAAGGVIGTQTATAAVDLPKIIAQGEQTIKLVDELINNPAMPNVIGVPESAAGVASKFGLAVPGSPEAGFTARLDQLKGQQFMQAYETLKGGGVITEIEGNKATDAISRMQKTNQSEEDFKKAASEFQSIIRGAINRAKMKAGAGAAPQGASGGWSIQRVD